ncbi:BamA/TamA family outer membrane protein [Oceanomicrobium pacificus]|uniref:BamA/TamA family outer membrane protein n=1 Tax=Oceanomicrobium pacificus TaxID=2692916 RepID=A0A6B0TU77_9RHOB|nr:BamA/TamA family outer membrane protein [Oceanomicrobium pacificus]MXU64774.1 BamA/TamA family outer membrane protein [Oceanomicrobium pacificus]
MRSLDESRYGFRQGDVIVAPIPINNPTIGTGLAGVVGYLYQLDADSPKSYLGIGGFRTNNGSQGYGFGTQTGFGDGRWRLGLLLGKAEVNYDFFGIGRSDLRLPIAQDALFAQVTAAYGFTPDILLGLKARYIDSEIDLDLGSGLPPDLRPRVESLLAGPTVELDFRDDDFYPTDGFHADLELLQSAPLESDTLDFTVASARMENYLPFGPDMMVATRLAACGVDGDAPFYELCTIGGTDGFRGYPVGQFRDYALLSAQAEFRSRLTERIGFTAFVGAGQTAADFGSFGSRDPALAGGAGFRFRLSKDFGLDFSIDAAANVDGDLTTYVYVGQRF